MLLFFYHREKCSASSDVSLDPRYIICLVICLGKCLSVISCQKILSLAHSFVFKQVLDDGISGCNTELVVRRNNQRAGNNDD
jgi:hypothetical protein